MAQIKFLPEIASSKILSNLQKKNPLQNIIIMVHLLIIIIKHCYKCWTEPNKLQSKLQK